MLTFQLLYLAVTLIVPISSQFPNTTYDFPVEHCNPDPWKFRTGPINVTKNLFFNISEGSRHSGAAAIGLSGLNIELNFNVGIQRLSFVLHLAKAYLVSPQYDASGELDLHPFRLSTFPSGTFRGKGQVIASIENLYIEGYLLTFYPFMLPKFGVGSIRVNAFNFTSVTVNAGRFEIDNGNGTGYENVDWDVWNKNFKSNFDTDWADMSIRNMTLKKIATNLNNLYWGTNMANVFEFFENPCPEEPARFGIKK